eukprot:jgi/Psemu1/55049/gm1.55049_g
MAAFTTTRNGTNGRSAKHSGVVARVVAGNGGGTDGGGGTGGAAAAGTRTTTNHRHYRGASGGKRSHGIGIGAGSDSGTGKHKQKNKHKHKTPRGGMFRTVLVVPLLVAIAIVFSYAAIFRSLSSMTECGCDGDGGNGDAGAAVRNPFHSVLGGRMVSWPLLSSLSSSLSSSSSGAVVPQHPPPPPSPPFHERSLEEILGSGSSSGASSGASATNNDAYTVLHTVTTRFMVGQARANPQLTSRSRYKVANNNNNNNNTSTSTSTSTSLFHLTKARYLLFETFCWPTMKFQSWQNYFWIVLVDPGLDPRIIRDLRTLLGSKHHFPAQNAFLVLTNNTSWSSDGIGVENATSYGVGLRPVAESYRNGTVPVLTGNTDYLLKALEILDDDDDDDNNHNNDNNHNKNILLVETLLDADDGLNNRGVEWIQTTAAAKTTEHKALRERALAPAAANAPPSLNTTWWLLCGTDHIEWHNRDVYTLSTEEYSKIGVTSGLAGLRKSPLFCTSAGFTRIGLTTSGNNNNNNNNNNNKNTNTNTNTLFPRDAYSNHALTFYFPGCTNRTSAAAAAATAATAAGSHGNYSACWHREFPDRAFVLKSRTITSDSMDHLNARRKAYDYRDISWLNETDYPLLIKESERWWTLLGEEFSIDRKKAWETSVYLFEQRRWILRENQYSRCAPGFPCYKEARKNHVRMERYWNQQAKAEWAKENPHKARVITVVHGNANANANAKNVKNASSRWENATLLQASANQLEGDYHRLAALKELKLQQRQRPRQRNQANANANANTNTNTNANAKAKAKAKAKANANTNTNTNTTTNAAAAVAVAPNR